MEPHAGEGRPGGRGPARARRPGSPAKRAHAAVRLQKGIQKLIRILEGEPNESSFNAEQYMLSYT
jgi:hypothetical protein